MLRTIARGRPAPLWRRYVSPANPAANASLTIPAPTGRVWQVLSVACVFTADSGSATRNVVLSHLDGDGNVLESWPLTASLAATNVRTISWQAGLGTVIVGAGTDIALPLGDHVYVFPGETLVISGTNHAGDTITKCRAVVLETDNGDTAHELALEQRIRDHAEAIHDLIGANR